MEFCKRSSCIRLHTDRHTSTYIHTAPPPHQGDISSPTSSFFLTGLFGAFNITDTGNFWKRYRKSSISQMDLIMECSSMRSSCGTGGPSWDTLWSRHWRGDLTFPHPGSCYQSPFMKTFCFLGAVSFGWPSLFVHPAF